ncbi:MAG TPA: restriction endonuclease subunit S [Paludibacteraceae bacterium]|nr:restriction endonuclease subunit S [Paludibacteraceae bacterium]
MKEENKKKSNLPNLRFPEFTGEWETVYLEDICDKIGDGIHSTPQYDENGDYFFINGNNFVEGTIQISETTKRVTKKEAKQHNIKHLTGNTILISINGTIGNLALYNNEPVMLGKSACYINPQKRNDRLFIFYQLGSKRVYKYFVSELTGSTIKNLSLKSIRQTIFHLPSIEEQNKISSLLFLIDQRISIQNKIIEQYKSLIKGLTHFALNGKQANIRLKDCVACNSSALTESEFEGIDGLHPVYGATGIIAYSSQYAVDKNSILVIKDGASVGRVQYVTGKYSAIGTLNYLTAKSGFSLKYIYYLLRYFNFDKYKVGSGIPHIYFKDYGNELIYCPSIKEQNKIARMLSQVDKKIDLEQILLDAYSLQKQYLLKKMSI